jgi:hypothetical protein
MSVRAQYASAGSAIATTAGGMLTLVAATRLTWFTGLAVAAARRGQARHDEVLAVVGKRGPAPGMVLLEDDRPAVYCVPGRPRIVALARRGFPPGPSVPAEPPERSGSGASSTRPGPSAGADGRPAAS